MPVFKCSNCGFVDNTACGNYWNTVFFDKKPPLCTLCDPKIKKWHGLFERIKAESNYLEGEDGFMYHKDELKPGGYFHGRVKLKTHPPKRRKG